MMSLLQCYCGLMAKQLILQIQSATDLHSIRTLPEMQWIATLQESRIEPTVLQPTLTTDQSFTVAFASSLNKFNE